MDRKEAGSEDGDEIQGLRIGFNLGFFFQQDYKSSGRIKVRNFFIIRSTCQEARSMDSVQAKTQ
jgi:hypothetical protein